MHVVATAGHVDHGKSKLVHALTGMQPDRWAEERRRGLTIDLGFVWTALPSGATVAFVDVPGHERFVPNMLAGVGPVPAAVFVVAADEGWMPQSSEHLAALHALDVRHAVLAITRRDLADPAAATDEARAELARTSLGADVESVAVSAPTGRGLDELRAALDRMLTRLPAPDVSSPVRLWVDRSFTVKGSGTVITGTLAAGRLRVGDELEVSPGHVAVVRGLQSLGRDVDEAAAVARVAVNLRGVEARTLGRGDAALTPRRFSRTDVADVRVHGDLAGSLPRTVTLHIGSAAVTARTRPLGTDTVRLSFDRALPLRLGDRGLLRDPGLRHVNGGVTALDVSPPSLTRRGAGAARADVLAGLDGHADELSELRRRGVVRRSALERMGVPVSDRHVIGEWAIDDGLRNRLQSKLPRVVDEWLAEHPLESGPPVEAVRQALRVPDRSVVHALVTQPLEVRDGRVVRSDPVDLPPAVVRAIEKLRGDLQVSPFAAPDAARLADLGLGARELAAAERVGALVRVADGVVLLPESIDDAATVLAGLTAPFTVSEARTALGTTRRVAVPLLEHLDRVGHTQRLPDDRRRIRSSRR